MSSTKDGLVLGYKDSHKFACLKPFHKMIHFGIGLIVLGLVGFGLEYVIGQWRCGIEKVLESYCGWSDSGSCCWWLLMMMKDKQHRQWLPSVLSSFSSVSTLKCTL